MAGLFEKSLHLGLGLFVYSRERIEEIVDDMVKKGQVAKKDAYKYTADLVKKGEEQKAEIKKIVKESVSEVVTNLGIKENNLSKDDIREIVREEVKNILEKKENSN